MANCEEQFKDRSDPAYAECKRKAGQVQSVDGKEVFIETEAKSSTTFDQVFSEVFSTKDVTTKGGELEIDFNFDIKNVDTSGGIFSDVYNFAKEGVNAAFNTKSKYSQESVETITGASGIFKQDREEGFKTLQSLTEGIPGFEVKKEKGKGIFLSYTNDKGKVVDSDELYFGAKATEGIEGSSELIGDQKLILKNFFDKNLNDVDLTEFKKIQSQRAADQIKAEADFMESDVVTNIKEKYQSEDLFTEKEGKPIYTTTTMAGGGGIKTGNEPNYMPYQEEIDKEIAKINNYIAQNNIIGKENTPEKIRKDAENRVRNNLTNEAVNEEKALFYSDKINSSIEAQISNTTGSIALKAVTKQKIIDNQAQIDVSTRDQKLNRAALEYKSGVLNGTRDTDPALEAKYEVTLKLLGINSKAEGFVSGMSFDNFLKAGSPKDLEEVTLKNGVQTTRSTLTNQKKLFDQFKSRIANYDGLVKKSDDLLDTVDDADFVNNLSVKNYDEGQANLRMIGSGFASMFKEVGYLSAKLLNAGSQYTPAEGSIGMFETNNIDVFLDAMSVKYDKEASLLTERYLNPVKFENAFKDPLVFGKFMMQEISTQIPIYLTMAASGNVAPLIIGMSSAGGKLSDMKADIAMGKNNYSAADMFFKPLLYGTAEGVLGTIPSVGIIKKNKNRFIKGLKNKSSSDLLSQGTRSYVKENFADAFVYEPLTELVTESLTTGFQNLIDGKPFTENMDHSAFSGFSMSLLMSGSSMAVSTYQSRYSSFEQRNDIRKKQKDLASLGQQYKKSSLKDPKSEQTILLQKEIEAKNIELNNAVEQSNEVVNNNLRAGHAEGVNRILATQTQMQTDAQTILNSTTLTDVEKQIKIEVLQKRYKQFESVKQSSFSKNNMMKYRPEFKLMQVNESDRYNDLLLEAEKQLGGENVTPEAIKRQAYEMYLREDVIANNDKASNIKWTGVNSKNNGKLIQHNTVEDAVDAIEASNLPENEKSRAIRNVKNGADGWADVNGAANVVIDNQVENQRKHVATHEVGHLAFWKIFEGNEQAFNPIAVQLLSSVRDINPDLYNEFVNDVEVDPKTGKMLSQEVIMRFLEFAAEGKMDPKKSALQGFFGTIIQKAFSKEYNFDFKGESDITSFVTELGKKIKDGTLSKADIQAASKNTSITGLAPLNTSSSVSSEKSGSQSFSKGDLKSQFDGIVQNEDGTRKFENKKDFDASIEKDDIQVLIETTNTLDASIRNLPGVTQAYLDLNPEFVEDVKRRISDKAMSEFNPGKNESFFGWMTGKNVTGKSIIELAAGDIQNRNKKEIDTSSIDASTRQVADQTTNTTTKPEVTPIIDVMKFAKKADPSIDIKAFEQDFNEGVKKLAKEKGIDITNPNLTSKQLQEITPYDVLAKVIGIPANKLSNPKDNLSKAESLKAQRLLLIAKPFVKNVVLGQANKQTQTVPSLKPGGKTVKVGGETLGLGRNILNKFFNPPKRVGNNYVRTPKKFDNEVYEAAIGVKDGKVDPNYIPRAAESQVIKGLLKGVAEQMANKGARNLLETKEQTSDVVKSKANLERGKNQLVFSAAPNTTLGQSERLITNKDKRFNYTSNVGEFIDTIAATNKVAEAFDKVYGKYNIPIKAKDALIQAWENINIQARLKEVEMDLGNPLKINQQKYLYEAFAESQSQVIRDVLGISKDGLNYSDINQMEGMNSTLMEVVNSYREAGKSEAEIYETMWTMASTFTGSSKIGNGTLAWKKQKNGDWKLVKNKNKKGDQRYDLYTNAGEMMNVLGLKKPKEFKPEKKVGQTKDQYINDLRKNDGNLSDQTLNKSADYAKKNKDAFFALLDWYKGLPAKQKAMHKNGMGMILASSYRGTKTLIRESAPVNSIAETDFSEGYGQYRYEHNPPASVMAIYSAEYLTDNKTKKQLQAEFDNFGVTIIPLSMDSVLDENYQSTIPLGNYGRFGRYYNPKNFGKFPFVTKLYYRKSDPLGIDSSINLVDTTNPSQVTKGEWDTRTYGDLAPAAFAIREGELSKQRIIDKGKKDTKGKKSLFLSAAPDQLSNEFNTIIEQTLGVDADKRFSDVVAKRRGAKKGNFRPFVPPSMEDFQGLMYDLYSRGALGDKQMKWVKDNLIDPYQKGVANIDVYRQTLTEDYKALLKKFPNVKNNLGKIVPGTDFTQDQAIRVSLWTKAGYEIPGISKRDAKKLNDFVANNPELTLFGEGAVLISKQNKWSKPDAYWDVQSILSDLNSFTNNVGRQQFLEQFNANVDAIFSNKNMNKLEASLGTNWRSAMEDSLYRMQTGTNRPSGTDKLVNSFMNWTNNSIGAIMFFNRKSALLQTISSVNFLNWSDNNPVKAAMAFANFPQFIKDFAFLWNSPKLKQRRSGLRSDVNEAEIANAVRGATNKAQAMLSYLLKLGFTPTQLADSFAIASGGATFYRNRLNTYKKDGLTDKEAEAKAFEDFSATSEVSQQSADPMFISQQQAGVLGRLILAFQNTPAQVTRLFKKATRDFINNRGDQKTNISKMVYYGAVQGFIFAALQNAIFIGADEDDDDENVQRKKELKQSRILNSMTDTLLRGSGVYGAIVATLKNTINTYYREKKKSAFAKDNAAVLLELANLSPPIGSKLRKINNALKTEDYKQDVMDKMNYDVTYKGRVILSPKYNVIASVVEGLSNIPLERAMNEFLALSEMMDQRNNTLQRISLALGYRSWDVGATIEEFDEIKIEAKQNRADASKERARLKKEEKLRLKEAKKYEGKTPEQIVYIKRYEVIMKQRKPEQIETLSELGLTTKQINALKYEKDRAKKILELQDNIKK